MEINTCIPALAMRMVAKGSIERRFMRRCGYPSDGSSIVIMKLVDQRATSDPHNWTGNRTMITAHLYLLEHWPEVGQVVDVRVILGEAEQPAPAEI